MKIKVDQIKDKPIALDENIPAVSWEIDSSEVKFVDNIGIHCEVRRIYKELLVQGELTTHAEIICSRCLINTDKINKLEFKKAYNIDTVGEYLNLDIDLREEILLNYPMKPLCMPDCKGLCSQCGKNLNFEKCGCSENLKDIRFEEGTRLDI